MPTVTMDSPPLLCDGTEYSAGVLRRALGALIADTIGVFEADDFDVTLSGSSVTVSPGRAALPSTATESSVYLVEAGAATTMTLAPADATRGRKDVLVAYVVPPASPTAVGVWKLEVRAGEPGPNPAAPIVANSLLLREFLVPSAAAGQPPSGVEKRFSGGQQLVAGPLLSGDTQPPNPKTGQLWTHRTTREAWLYDGVAWVRVRGIPVVGTISEVVNPFAGQVVVDGTGVVWQREVNGWRPLSPLGIIGGREVTGLANLGGTVSNNGVEVAPSKLDSGLIAMLPNRRHIVRSRYKIQGTSNGDWWVMRLRVGNTAGTGGDQIRQDVQQTRNSALGFTYEITAEYKSGPSFETKVFTLTGHAAGPVAGTLQFLGGDNGASNLVGVWVEDGGPTGKTATTAS